jgi:hypothetical protein
VEAGVLAGVEVVVEAGVEAVASVSMTYKSLPTAIYTSLIYLVIEDDVFSHLESIQTSAPCATNPSINTPDFFARMSIVTSSIHGKLIKK